MNLKLLFFLLLILAGINTLSAQELPPKTTWEGKLSGIRLILKLSEDSLSKEMTAEFDSPDQGALGLKVSELTITKDSLIAYSSVIGGGFAGAFNADKTKLTGSWRQGGGELSLVLERVANLSATKRPQTPKAPFPYVEEKVIYRNQDKTIQYGATLTIPDTTKAAPTVILITGSGQQDRDETLFGHKPFWVIADHLSRNGIAVLRVDDRGVGLTTGDVMNATSLDFVQDVLAGVDFLKAHKGIDHDKIGLIGHSEGGVIAPMVALQSNDIAFIVSLAGVGVRGADLMYRQLRQSYNKLGLNEEEMNKLDSLTRMMINLGDEYTNKDELKVEFGKYMREWLEKQSEDFLIKAGFKGPNSTDYINRMATQFFSPWMRYFLRYDPATTLAKIKIPVLALNGGKDIQVNAEENLAGFDKLLTKAGNKNFKTIVLPNLNHLFQHAETGEISEYATIEETISPEVLTIMTRWINEVAQ